MKFAVIAFAFIFSTYALAKKTEPLSPKLQPLFEALKNTGVNFKPDGTVCEQVVILQMQQAYPVDQYVITAGVEYEVGDGTLGELDLVIQNKATRQVEVVGEVKCWHDFGAAMDKAKVQRDRFMWNLTQFPDKITFAAHDKSLQFTEADFQGLNKFIFISNIGGVKKGFDFEIPYNLPEMRELQDALVRCQNKGLCPLDKAE